MTNMTRIVMALALVIAGCSEGPVAVPAKAPSNQAAYVIGGTSADQRIDGITAALAAWAGRVTPPHDGLQGWAGCDQSTHREPSRAPRHYDPAPPQRKLGLPTARAVVHLVRPAGHRPAADPVPGRGRPSGVPTRRLRA
jgi:hypothetical protein